MTGNTTESDLTDIADEQMLTEIEESLEALADTYGHTNVMYAIHSLTFGDTDWANADSEGHILVHEGEASLVDHRRGMEDDQ